MRLFATALLLITLLLLAPISTAQTPGSCPQPLASADLTINDVEARLYNNGALFWKGGTPTYEVPQALETNAIFAAGIWIGGQVDGQVRFAGADYSHWEFWAGPLDDGATLPEADCQRTNTNGREAWDRIYVVSTDDVAAYDDSGIATDDLADWPVGLGAPTVDAMGDPVEPTDRDQLIDLAAGERPVIYGSQTAFWVMNDVGGPHLWSGSNIPPLGIEVQVSAFEVADGEVLPLYQSTFYRYRIINRNSVAIENVYLTVWTDTDLGNFNDDYMGSDSTRGMGYTYNGDGYDQGTNGYGFSPPALGVDLLSGAGSVMTYFGDSSPLGNPADGAEAYPYMQGRWRDGTPMTEGGLGYMTGGPITTYIFSGEPEAGAFWSEFNIDGQGTANTPSDRRFLTSTPSFSLQPGESYTVDIGILFAFGSGNLSSITALRAASDEVQARYDAGALFDTVEPNLPLPPTGTPTPTSPEDGTVFTEGDVMLSWTAASDADYYVIEVDTSATFSASSQGHVAGTTITLDSLDIPVNQARPFYWRVRGATAGGLGPASEARSFTYDIFQFIIGPLRLSNGEPAFVEVVGPDGADPCGPDATSTFGCDEVGGNWIYPSFNGTNEYLMHSLSAGPEAVLANYAPNDYEIRWTDEGSYAAYIFSANTLVEVPFEVWDIGFVEPGTENDPSDDVQLIPVLFADGGGECAFNFGETEDLGYPATDRIYAYYPLDGMSHDDWVTYAQPLVEANGGCAPAPAGDQPNYFSFADGARGRPLQRVIMLDNTGTGDLGIMQGSVQRFYTTDPPGTANEDGPGGLAEGYRLSAAYPNPFAQRTRVPFSLPTAGHVRLVAYDLLGRQVAVLHEGPVAAGMHEATFEAEGLASGVYVVVLEAEGMIQTRQKILLVR
ncbi:MAG: T9SS type A sorting domain-containing protein [Rhodothermaceae bacterium]|nr:T9SS type A sorting domain-containing protein [Rhodothermaceae bacterium]